MGKWLAVTAVVTTVTGCNYGASAFQCSDDLSCGTSGKCEANSLCSFPDTSGACGGGRRYGDLAGTQSGKCVDGTQPPIDAADAMPDAPPDARVCFGTALVNGLSAICFEAPPMGDRTIAATTEINTDDPNMCTRVTSGGNGVCVIAAQTINVNATLRAYGSKPLVLLAIDTIAVSASGVIDVASHRGVAVDKEIGAGGDPGTCQPGTLPTLANNTNGGGAGGVFAGRGGDAGDGGGPGGGQGGTPPQAISPLGDLRGGCPGQDGQGGGATKGLKGHGGGAVLLIAGGSITVTGKVNASGEGGDGGITGGAGGGGGGAGGMIALDAPAITATAGTTLLLANGGGGGEGSGATTRGNPGADPNPTTTAAAAGGTGGSTNGANGGTGSSLTFAGGGGNAGNAANNSGGGGGGGGGGAGFIKAATGANIGANVISPRLQ